MRAALVKFCAAAAAVAICAAVALLPALSPPRQEGFASPVRQSAPFDGYLYAVVQGEGVAFPGSYRIARGTTYGELFALAGFSGSSPYPLEEEVRLGEDAVLGEDGIWRAYIVV